MNTLGPTELAVSLLKQGHSTDEILKTSNFPTLGAYLFEFICKRDISVNIAADLSELNKTSLYRILDGKLNPTRNALIRLSRVLEMNYDETQYLLKCGNVASLSGTRARDIKIIEGILHNRQLGDINEELIKSGFSDLSSKHRSKE